MILIKRLAPNIFKLIALGNISIQVALAYVASIWAVALMRLTQIIVFYYLWVNIFDNASQLNGFTFAQISTYLVLSRIFYSQFQGGVHFWISNLIKSGDIVVHYLRPMNFLLMFFGFRLADFPIYFIISGIPIIAIFSIFFDFLMPDSIVHLLMFILSTILAVIIAYFTEIIFGFLAFYTTNTWGLFIVRESILSFFSGAIIPIVFFPQWLLSIANVLPFKDIVFTPISIYLGYLNMEQTAQAFLSQITWILILYVLSKVIYTMGIKKLNIQGG